MKGFLSSNFSDLPQNKAWGTFLQILSIKAERAGLLAIAVLPGGTSQNCSGCGTKVPKQLKDRIHACPECKLILGRDHNAAVIIKHRAVGHSVLKAHLTSEAIAGVDEKPTLYASASV